MTDQRKSPAEGQGFDNSRGGECLEALCREILQKSKTVRITSGSPSLWHWTNSPGMPLRAMLPGPSWVAGETPHGFKIMHEVRRANDAGLLYPILLIGDGTQAGISLDPDRAEAWLRGEAGA